MSIYNSNETSSEGSPIASSELDSELSSGSEKSPSLEDMAAKVKEVLIEIKNLKNKFEQEIKTEIKEVKKENIGILSIFIAVITFLFSSVNILKEGYDFFERFGLLIGLGAILIGFLWLLNHVTHLNYSENVDLKKDRMINEYLKNTTKVLFAIGFLMFAIVSILVVIRIFF